MRLVQASFLGVAWLTALTAVVACNRTKHVDRDGLSEPPSLDNQGERVGVTTVTGAEVGSLSNGLAIERIVAARCSRETACNNVGADKRFTNYELCTSELRSKVEELGPRECLRGMDAGAIDNCLDAISSESCNSPSDTLQRLAACRMSAMCIKM